MKTNLGKENNEFYYESNNNISNQFLGIYKINNNNSYNYDQSNDEETDIKQKIKNFSEFLTIYPFNFNIP